MSDLILPHNITNGMTPDADEVMDDFNAIKTFLNTTGAHKFQAGTVDAAAIAADAVGTSELAPDSVTSTELNLSPNSTNTVPAIFLNNSYQDILSLAGLTAGTYLIFLSVGIDTASASPVAGRLNIDSGASTPIAFESATAGNHPASIQVASVTSSIVFQAKRASGAGICAISINGGNLVALRIA